jgi:hypothetical protein
MARDAVVWLDICDEGCIDYGDYISGLMIIPSLGFVA